MGGGAIGIGALNAAVSREGVARTHGLGACGEPDYAFSAGDGAELLGQEGRIAVIERKPSVRECEGMIFECMILMSFGRRRLQALTVTMLKPRERTLAAARLRPDRRATPRLRVRRYIEEGSGPRIEATRPEQTEIAKGNPIGK
jgi:hypothetical protein